MRLSEIVDTLVLEMDAAEELRERSLRDSRSIIRESKRAIQCMHRGEDPTTHLNECRRHNGIILGYLQGDARGAVEDAMMELAEAFILYAVLNGQEVPSPEELEVTTRAWVLGLGDVPGELRRRCLDLLRAGKVEDADSLFEIMETVHEELMRFDHPDAVLPLRRKQDVSRGVVERTRGDVAMARR